MQVRKIDEMNLYDYVMVTFDRICDLTEGRRISLNYYLNNANAKHINMALFKSVFGVSSFSEIMELLTDETRFDELHGFGLMIQEDVEKEEASVLNIDMSLKKVPVQQQVLQ